MAKLPIILQGSRYMTNLRPNNLSQLPLLRRHFRVSRASPASTRHRAAAIERFLILCFAPFLSLQLAIYKRRLLSIALDTRSKGDRTDQMRATAELSRSLNKATTVFRSLENPPSLAYDSYLGRMWTNDFSLEEYKVFIMNWIYIL